MFSTSSSIEGVVYTLGDSACILGGGASTLGGSTTGSFADT
jgi:hypothetical protein